MTLRSWTILNSFLVIVIYRYYFGRSTTTLHEIFDYHWGQRYVMVQKLTQRCYGETGRSRCGHEKKS